MSDHEADCCVCGTASKNCAYDIPGKGCCKACDATGGHLHCSRTPREAAKPSGSDSPGPAAPDGTVGHPAASEAPQEPRLHVTSALGRPETGQDARERRTAALEALGGLDGQDAREVESQDALEAERRRKKWARTMFDHEASDYADYDAWLTQVERNALDRALNLADREHATLVTERDRARDLAARLEEELAQAVGERDRLRAGIEALIAEHTEANRKWAERFGLASVGSVTESRLRILLATPTPDAQDERPTMTDAASVGIGSHQSAWLNDPTPAPDAQGEVRRG